MVKKENKENDWKIQSPWWYQDIYEKIAALVLVLILVIVLTKSASASILSCLLHEEERKIFAKNIFSASINE